MGDLQKRTKAFEDLMNETKVDTKYLSYDDSTLHPDLLQEMHDIHRERQKIYQNSVVKTIETYYEDKFAQLEKTQARDTLFFESLFEADLAASKQNTIEQKKKQESSFYTGASGYEHAQTTKPINIDSFFDESRKPTTHRYPASSSNPFIAEAYTASARPLEGASLVPQAPLTSSQQMQQQASKESASSVKFEETQAEVLFQRDVFQMYDDFMEEAGSTRDHTHHHYMHDEELSRGTLEQDMPDLREDLDANYAKHVKTKDHSDSTIPKVLEGVFREG